MAADQFRRRSIAVRLRSNCGSVRLRFDCGSIAVRFGQDAIELIRRLPRARPGGGRGGEMIKYANEMTHYTNERRAPVIIPFLLFVVVVVVVVVILPSSKQLLQVM